MENLNKSMWNLAFQSLDCYICTITVLMATTLGKVVAYHGCGTNTGVVNIAKFLKTPTLKNIYERLLLYLNTYDSRFC